MTFKTTICQTYTYIYADDTCLMNISSDPVSSSLELNSDL